MDFTHWRVNPKIVRAVIDKSADTVQWLEDKGVAIIDVPRFIPNQVFPTYHMPAGAPNGGRLVVKTLLKVCEDIGVRLLRRTAAKKILTGESREVAGVLALARGGELRISARSIVIGTGGYAGNKELLKKYCPYYTEDIYMWGLPHMGDGLLMATEIGAATDELGVVLVSGAPSLGAVARKFPCLSSIVPPAGSSIIHEPTGLWVNPKGERFVDESVGYFMAGNVVLRQPDKVFYTLFDDMAVQKTIKAEATGDFSRFRKSGFKQTGLKKELQLAADKDILKTSDSWEEIAKWMGADRKVLKATVDEYNSFCDRGYDAILAKNRRYLQALRNPPYYAVRCHARFSTTIGGIKINHRMEVLDHDNEPIPGLYAGGDATGGWEYDSYEGLLTGFASGFALNSGRIAGENAAKYAREMPKRALRRFIGG